MAAVTMITNEESTGRLKAELLNLRRKGALKASADWDSTGPDPDRSCGRCRAELGRIINRGAYCPSCRLKVCKGCREYTFRTTDWICTVCHKRMEIQTISGEWMNEFIRKPSKRRDNRVYVPAADIIKRTIRRSWTISNPLPRWNAPRGSSDLRPYSSLPRGQDINNYPSLSMYNARKTSANGTTSKSDPQEPKSEEVKDASKKQETNETNIEETTFEKTPDASRTNENPADENAQNDGKKGIRENPLMKAAKEGKLNPAAVAFEMPIKIINPIPTLTQKEPDIKEETAEIAPDTEMGEDQDIVEAPKTPEKSPKRRKNLPSPFQKRVSFECKSGDESDGFDGTIKKKEPEVFKKLTSKSLEIERPKYSGVKVTSKSLEGPVPSTTALPNPILKNDDLDGESRRSSSEHDSEVSSGSVYRRVTVRRRRQDLRKMATVDSGWRRSTESSEILDFLLPDGDDYKLVFINSDSSSKEEDVDDNDSSSTASSFMIDECDWDYFEPACPPPRTVINWNSPFGSPHFYRRSALSSPLGSPLVYRRKKSSDIEIDERRYSSSPTSSDSFCMKTRDAEESPASPQKSVVEENAMLQCVHQETVAERQGSLCRNCGNPPQYIPVPVPVPIPVPVWPQQSSESVEQFLRARVSQFSRSLFPNANQFPLAWPLVSGAAADWTSLFSLQQHNAIDGATSAMPVVEDDSPIDDNNGESADSHQQQRREEQVDVKLLPQPEDEREIAVDCVEIGGHLDAEKSNVFSEASSDNSDSESGDENGNRNNRIPLRRSYNVTGDNRESDDALPSSDVYSDNDEEGRLSQTSFREDDSSSSGSADTDSDDTGTVADQKPNRFSRVFVVNPKSSSSSSSSDNDSNNEKVILKNIKRLSDHEIDLNEQNSEEKVKKESGWLSSSPALSDVSAESLNSSSDTDDEASVSEKNEEKSISGAHDDNAGASVPFVPPESVEPDDVVVDVEGSPPAGGVRAGELTAVVSEHDDGALLRQPARYTSLVMITQQESSTYPHQVSVVASDTTSLVPDVIVQHKNCASSFSSTSSSSTDDKQRSQGPCEESVTVVSSATTLSNVVCLEEGLADDDSWVENLSHDEDDGRLQPTTSEDGSTSGDEITLTCTAAIDQEDELRGYHRSAIDFTLHTIVEESCEESEVEQGGKQKKTRPHSTTDLEKYFFFGLGDGNIANANQVREDTVSETSSICSEGLDSFGGNEECRSLDNDPNELATSRLEKYFLSGFMGFTTRRDSDGSVGSDSEGHPSPEQRRKRLVRARGTGRSHSSSLDNLLAHEFSTSEQQNDVNGNSGCSSSSDTDVVEESNFEKLDGQFDTVKRKKCKKQRNMANGSSSSMEELKNVEETKECLREFESDDHIKKDFDMMTLNNDNATTKQSRDSGFVSSSDDLLKDQKDSIENSHSNSKTELKLELESIAEEKKIDEKYSVYSTPPATSLIRKDSFNNWSSDEETNLMMSKMRQFFKTMVASYNTQSSQQSSKPTTPILGVQASESSTTSSPRSKYRLKPPQLVYFENELTRLMKTVPGIRDDQVREIVEYLSSEDTWSDSYDSSDYTSSDLEGNAGTKAALQRQISDSCQQIINKFDTNDKEGDEGDGGLIEEQANVNPETALVYQKLVASIEKLTTYDDADLKARTPHSSPPIIAKVMHHIGSRLVALMHEVSSGESHVSSSSPKSRYYHRKLHPKLSNASSTTTEDEDSLADFSPSTWTEKNNPDLHDVLQRSKSHDILLAESTNLHQSSSGVSDIAEERETSDYERFSWRGSFESALMATDSRNKLSLIGTEGSASASALAIAAKRRSAGDLIFSNKSLSREQLDRVRSCGSIGGGNSEDKLWVSAENRQTKRRLSVPDATAGSGVSADGEDDEDEKLGTRATLPRSLQVNTATTNSLPRLPTATPSPNMHKSQSIGHFFQPNAKSARYRPPGFGKFASPKRAFSAPGLQPCHRRRTRKSQPNLLTDDANISEASSSPTLVGRGLSKSATPSPVAPGGRRVTRSNSEWRDDDIDRMFGIHQTRSCLSTLGIRSDSMASVYSGAGEGRYGTVAVRGQVEFGLQYNYKAGCLEIHIKQCKDLAAVDMKRNRSDPYVKVYLLPDKSKSGKRKTKVKKHTLNPIFDEVLKFHMSLNSIETRTLWLTVWHSDMFGRNDFLGEVMIALENKVFDDPTPKWYNLQERTEPFDEILSFKGDILVGLKFVPPDMTTRKKGKHSRGSLHVLVKEAKSLTAIKASGNSDPFCKSYLLPDKGRSSKQKTPVIRKTINPVWNHTFVYDDVTLQELAERCLELTIWDHDRLGSNEFLGGVRFSLGSGKHYLKPVDWMDSTGKEISLWKSMLERPNFWVEGCLPLRPTLDYRAS